MIAGGYQILTASGWGNTAEEAKRNALESHPERNAWSMDELTATPDPISLGSSKVEPTLYKGQVAGSTPALATAFRPSSPTVEALDLKSNQCRFDSGFGQSNFDPVAQMEEPRISNSTVPSSSLGGVITFPTVACVLLTSVLTALSSVCADGGESISPRTMGLGQTTGPAWDSGGAADPSPRRATGSARGESISAGAGVVSGQSAARFESSATNTGPADSISVASGTDRKRPHESKPWLSPDLLGAQSERAVSMLGGSSSPLTSPTENSFPTPNLGFTRGFAATGLHSSAGVGNSFTPAVGVNQADRRAKRELREETGLMASVHGRRSSHALKGVEQAALSARSGGMPDIGPAARLSCARNLASVAVAGNGATAARTERRGESFRTGVTAGETATFRRIFASAFALATVVLTAFSGLAVLCASAASGRLEDR